jgi:two-component system phosphate regulon response regulator PhoB
MGFYVAKERHILVVNDEDSTLFGISIALRVAGYRVSVARDGMEALGLLEESGSQTGDQFDLLITDWSTSKIQGAEMVADLLTRGLGLPMIVMTGMYDCVQDDLQKQIPICVMQKPFLAGELIQEVDKFFEKSRPAEKSCNKCKRAVDGRIKKELITTAVNETG